MWPPTQVHLQIESLQVQAQSDRRDSPHSAGKTVQEIVMAKPLHCIESQPTAMSAARSTARSVAPRAAKSAASHAALATSMHRRKAKCDQATPGAAHPTWPDQPSKPTTPKPRRRRNSITNAMD